MISKQLLLGKVRGAGYDVEGTPNVADAVIPFRAKSIRDLDWGGSKSKKEGLGSERTEFSPSFRPVPYPAAALLK